MEVKVTHKVYAETEDEAIGKAEKNESHTRYEKPTGFNREVVSIGVIKETGKQWTTATK